MEVRGLSPTRQVTCTNITLTDWCWAYNNGGPSDECSLPEMLLHEAAGTSVHDWATLDSNRCSEEGKEQTWNGKWMRSFTQIANGLTWAHSREARACPISAQRSAQHQTHVDVMRKFARPLHCAKHVKCNEGGGSSRDLRRQKSGAPN